MSTVSADPDHLDQYAGSLATTEQWLLAHGTPLQAALDRFMQRCPEFGFCPEVSGSDVAQHAERGGTLAEWTGSVGHAVRTADEAGVAMVGWIGASPRTVFADDVDSHLLALGAFAIPEQGASWRAGLELGERVHLALDQGDADSAEAILRSLGELEDNELAVSGALAALGDLDAIEDRIDQLRPKGSLAGPFLGGAWDATTGTLATAWSLTGRVLHDPSGFGEAWSGLGSGLWWGVQHPGDFALAVIDWEGLQEDPVRWLGALVPEAAATVATSGAAAAAGRGSSAVRGTLRAASTATDVGDVLRHLRRLPDSLAVDVSQRLRTIGGRRVTWTPIGAVDEGGDAVRVSLGAGRGPLARLSDQFSGNDPTRSFRGAQYVVRRTDEPVTLYRVDTPRQPGDSYPRGRFWTTVEPTGPTQAQLDLALVPDWGNRAREVTVIEVPAGQVIYEGLAAPQPLVPDWPGAGMLPGGGPQVIIPHVPDNWILDVHHVLD